MNLMAVRRNTDQKPEELSWLGSSEQLPELLGKSDFIVIACDLNASTGGLFNALKTRSIGGAVIDTWYNYNEQGKPEVSPYNYPFNELDNNKVRGQGSFTIFNYYVFTVFSTLQSGR